MSTPSVTKHVSSLEKHFNARLLNRTTRRMSLTEEGQRCYEKALQLLGEIGELEDILRQTHKLPSGTLRIDMSTVISRLYVAPALPRFTAANPGLRVKASIGDGMIDMVDEGVDVSIRIGNLQNSGLFSRTLCKTTYVCCASPEFIRQHGLPSSPEDLDLFPCMNFLRRGSRQARPWSFERNGEKHVYTPESVIGFDHPESLIEAAKSGGGIIQLLSVTLRPLVRAGELVPVLEEWAAPGPDVSALYQQRHQHSAKVAAFIDFAEQLFRA